MGAEGGLEQCLGGPVPPIKVYIYNRGWGYTDASGITAWPRAFEALADGGSQLDAGARPGMLSAGGDAGMCPCALAGLEAKGLGCSSCSSEKWVLGEGFAHPLPLKTADLKLFLVTVASPLLFPAPHLLGLFLLVLELKRVFKKKKKNSTNMFAVVSNWELRTEIRSETRLCSALGSAGCVEHPRYPV